MEEEVNGKKINVLEMIILNSPVLRESKTDLEDGLSIAKKFYNALGNKENYNGIRVFIISNHDNSKQILGLSKNYYYDKTLLMY